MTSDSTPVDADALNEQASVLMKDGLRLLGEGTPEAATAALACFDEALEMRKRLPLDGRPEFGYALAACWLNRADALGRLGGAHRFEAALISFDEAIAVLRTLPLDGDDSRFIRRLAIACQNRGLALRALGGEHATHAAAAFTDGITLLQSEAASRIPDQGYLLSAALTNLANERVYVGTGASMKEGHDAALQAMACVAAYEADNVDAAEVGMKARHVLCQTLAYALTMTAQSGQVPVDLVHATTDAVDDGLQLVRLWEQRGVDRYRELALDLFRFGARVYASYQPHFLDEFVSDNSDPAQSSEGYAHSPEMQVAAQEALGLLTPVESTTT